MTCRQTEALLSALVDGELRGDQMRAVRRHLEGCPACRRERDELAAVKRLVGGASAPGAEVSAFDAAAEDRLVAYVMGSARAEAAPRHRIGFGRFALTAAATAAVVWTWLQFAPVGETPAVAAGEPADTGYTVERDQAFLAGGDPATGYAPVWTVGDVPR